jgi:hypothetical protein
MSFLPRLPAKRSVYLGFVGLAACVGCSSSAADGGASGIAGSASGIAGSASGIAGSAPSGGGNAGGLPLGGEAGNAGERSAGDDSGGASSAGVSGGGASGTATAGGHGGQGPACDFGECFVANTCLDQCGGKAVYVGCCECDPPSVNQNSCVNGH